MSRKKEKEPIGWLEPFGGMLHIEKGITSSLATAMEDGADVDGEVFVTKAGIRYSVHKEKGQ